MLIAVARRASRLLDGKRQTWVDHRCALRFIEPGDPPPALHLRALPRGPIGRRRALLNIRSERPVDYLEVWLNPYRSGRQLLERLVHVIRAATVDSYPLGGCRTWVRLVVPISTA